MNNISAADFTVKYTISENMWDTFKNETYKHLQLPSSQSAPEHQSVDLKVVTF